LLLSGELATSAISVLALGFYALVMAAYDLVLTAVAIGMAFLNAAALRYVARKRRDDSQRLQRSRGQVEGAAAGGLQMIESLKATGTEHEFFIDWAGRHAKAINAEGGLATTSAFVSVVPSLLVGLNTVLILGIGGHRVIDGVMTVGMLVAFQTLVASFMEPVNLLVGMASRVQEIEADMNRLDDVTRYPTDPQVRDDPPASDEAPTVRLAGYVELRNVTFGYSRLEQPLIQDFNLLVRPGQRVALVGGSGSGKSTLAKLVSGLYTPWEGEVLLDGRPRDAWPRSVLSNSVALVDQEIFLFEGSVRDNLTMWDRTLPAHNTAQAARDACIHDDIARRQDGFDGTLEEGGLNLSGGQRQRLEIARALATNPSILILDEATSALDAVIEKEIDDNLRRRGCTCLIIAHRLSTIRDADEIVVLDAGRVVQRGTHETLKSVPGVYSRLIEA
jgi:ABC-type bacteriocin/lantibiotic exporter with double-glycine peptidase domain